MLNDCNINDLEAFDWVAREFGDNRMSKIADK